MLNRLKDLPLPVQKHLYEIAGFAGTVCGSCDSPEYNHAMGAYLFATPAELNDFLFDYARFNLEHRISWHEALQEARAKSYKDWRRVYGEYLRSPEWQRKRQAVINRAMQSILPEQPVIRRTRDRYGRLIESIETQSKPICELVECSNDAEHVHHHNYKRAGKERIGRASQESEDNDLLALCGECHANRHKKQQHKERK